MHCGVEFPDGDEINPERPGGTDIREAQRSARSKHAESGYHILIR